MYLVIRGVFYYELEHSLDDFEVKNFNSYKEAAIDSLNSALEHFNHRDCDDSNIVQIRSNVKNIEVRKQINNDIERIKNDEKPMSLIYGGNHLEYHIKISYSH